MGPVALRLRGRTLTLQPGRPLLMGVLNASPESFSDGADAGDLDAGLRRADALLAAGADLLDVGGESGVTSLPPVPEDEERRRVVPLVDALVERGATVSVDTWKPSVAEAVLAAGASMVNDVSGLASPELAERCADVGAGLVVAHTRAAPKTKAFPHYDDVVADVAGFLAERLERAVRLGVAAESVVLDPGPDLAKSPAETVRVLRGLDRLLPLGRPVLLAVSRKDFVGALTGRPPRQRLAGTLAAIGEGVDGGATIVRAHDVAEVREFLAVRRALRGEDEVAADLHLPVALRRER